jgi:hypothetical protein
MTPANTRRAGACIAAALVMTAVVLAAQWQQGSGALRAEKPNDQSSRIDPEWLIQDAGDAVARAIVLTGIVPDFDTAASLTVLADDNTPFLSHEVLGRTVWHVTISDSELGGAIGAPDLHMVSSPLILDVLIEPSAGKLIRIASRWPDNVAAIPPEPDADNVAEQFTRSGKEKYHDFPNEDPLVAFWQALNGVADCWDPKAAQVVAQYVRWSRLDREPQPVWAITLRGIAPYEAAFPGVSEDARNHIRVIVDAFTGECICGSSTPQPLP